MTFEDELDIITESFELDLIRAERDFHYAYEMALASDIPFQHYVQAMYEAGENEIVDNGDSGKKKSIFSRIIDSIARFIQDLNTSISNIFRKEQESEDTSAVEAYFASQTGQVRLSYDMQAMEQAVNKKILEGRKVVQAISSTTGVPDDVVAQYCDSCVQLVDEYGGSLVRIAALDKIRKYVSEGCLKGMDAKVSKFKECETWEQKTARVERERKAAKVAAKATKDMKRAAQLKKVTDKVAEKASNIVNKDMKRAAQLQKVATSVSNMVKKAGDAKRKVASEIRGQYNAARSKLSRKGTGGTA